MQNHETGDFWSPKMHQNQLIWELCHGLRWRSLQRSPRPPSWWGGWLAAPPQEPCPRSRPFANQHTRCRRGFTLAEIIYQSLLRSRVTYDSTSENLFTAVSNVLRSLLLQTSHVAWTVCLCARHTGELCKNGWTDRDAAWEADSCGSKESCIRRGQDRTNPLAAAMGDRTAMRLFVELLGFRFC